MTTPRKIFLALVLLVSLSASAALLWQLHPPLTKDGIPDLRQGFQHQISKATEAFPLNILTFGLSDIWSQIKCQLETLAASHRFRCNSGPFPTPGPV